jgi:hypothetical protein
MFITSVDALRLAINAKLVLLIEYEGLQTSDILTD